MNTLYIVAFVLSVTSFYIRAAAPSDFASAMYQHRAGSGSFVQSFIVSRHDPKLSSAVSCAAAMGPKVTPSPYSLSQAFYQLPSAESASGKHGAGMRSFTVEPMVCHDCTTCKNVPIGFYSCIHRAAMYGHANCLKYIIRHFNFESVHDKIFQGLQPLHLAVKHYTERTHKNYQECIKLLLNAKASLEATDDAGKTPLSYACHREVQQLLIHLGAKVRDDHDILPTAPGGVEEQPVAAFARKFPYNAKAPEVGISS